MKKEIYILAVVIAALFACSSCQKENLPDNSSENGVRIITAEFENKVTKTTLNADGLTPKWEAGDVIRILGSSSYQDVILESSNISDNKITFSTNLTGTLYAVYPASATTLTSCSNGNVTITIPAFQDGTFASANICVAKSVKDDGTNKDNMVFRNATSVLEIKTSSSVIGVDITAANNITGSVTVSFSGNDINLTPNLDSKSVFVVRKSAPSDKVFYLAAAPETTGNTTATCYKIDKEGSITKDSKTLARNVIYSMDLSGIAIETDSDLTGKTGVLNGHEFVIIKAKYDGTNKSYLKWATMNIGATTVAGNYATCYGDLYEWGSVETIYKDRPWASASTGDFTNKWKDGITAGYAWQTYCENSNFVEWNPAPYDATTKILKPEKDAATQNWGTDWRMPTAAEFKALCEACGKTGNSITPTTGNSSTTAQGVYWCINYNNVPGCLFIVKKNGPRLFFPATGGGSGTKLSSPGTSSGYWSSSLSSSEWEAYNLNFCYSTYLKNVSPQYTIARYYGFPVRPVSD